MDSWPCCLPVLKATSQIEVNTVVDVTTAEEFPQSVERMLGCRIGLIISSTIVNIVGMECLARIRVGIRAVGMIIIGSV